METKRIIKVAKGDEKPDLLLTNCNVVNVFSCQVEKQNIAIADKKIAGIGDYQKGKKVLDLKGAYVAPGFIDAHVHIESSMITPFEFARAVLPLGTTSAVVDPHEIANVLGHDGIKFMLESSKHNHISLYFMLPSCVPASKFETSGSTLSAVDLLPFMNEKWVRGLGEVMNFPGVLTQDPDLMAKIEIAKMKRADGHAPGLSGKALNAYVAAGISSDHECITPNEALEKLACGMKVFIREGSGAKNLDDLIPVVTKENCGRFLFCTDDRNPNDLVARKHINYCIKRAIKLGLDPIAAIKMATINVAEHFKIDRKGAIAPGYWADLVVFDNFTDFHISKVLRSGIIVAQNYKFIARAKKRLKLKLRGSVNVGSFKAAKLKVKDQGKRIRVIETIKDQLITKCFLYKPKHIDSSGNIMPDISSDILKIAVIERHLASGNIGVGFVRGFNLKRGAIASTVAHDSHNIVVVGTNDDDMEVAIHSLIDSQGGQVVVENKGIKALLPLPIGGLMSDKEVLTVAQKKAELIKACQELGVALDNAFMSLSFLSLPVIPDLKITDKGLVDVNQFAMTPLYV